MTELVKVVILSHKRWNKVDTLKTVSNASLCVAESQAELYRQNYPDVEIIVHPDSVKGLSAKIRWTYQKFKNVVMLDDDLSGMVRNYVDSSFGIPFKVEPDTVYDILQHNAAMAKELGVKFYGFGSCPRPLDYNSMAPFKLTGFVMGGSFGFLDGFNMVLPDECVAACDSFLSAVSLFYHRYHLIDTRYSFKSKEATFKSVGGMSDFRTLETEKEDFILLRKYFGDAIELRKKPVSRKSLQHPYERKLIPPW